MARNRFPNKSAKSKKSSPFDRALNYLFFRARSEKEVRDYLNRFELDIEAREEIISRLKRLNYLDDEAFAKQFIESRSRTRPRSRGLLELELKRKGIKLDPGSPILDVSDLKLAQLA